MLRLGLVCKFFQAPIRFRTTTATSLLKMERAAALAKVARLVGENVAALRQAFVQFCGKT